MGTTAAGPPLRLRRAEADDPHGEEHDLISQHYGISKADLVLVLDLASSALDGRHAIPNGIHDNCPACDAAFPLGRIVNTVEWTSAPTWRRDRRTGAGAIRTFAPGSVATRPTPPRALGEL